MSGIEVVGTIAAVIGILDGSAKVWANARKDLNISDTFQTVAARLPILQDTLSTCNKLLEPHKGTLPRDAANALLKTVKNCEIKAAKLHKIFEETIPGDGEEGYIRYRKVVKRLGKGSKVEDLIKSIAEDVQIVANYRLVKTARSDLGDQLAKFVKQVDALGPSLHKDDEPGNVFNAVGGTMHNNLTYGTGPQNTGSGDMYNISGLTGSPVFNFGPGVATPRKFTGMYSHSSSRTVQKYVARPELEERLRAQLIGRKDKTKERRTVVVWGLGGSGKSQLTLNYVQKHQEAYGPTFWIDARDKETIERDLTHIHKLLYPGLNTPSATVEDAIAAVKNWLSTDERRKDEQRALWIMDSADAIDQDHEATSYIDIDHYLPDALNLDVIITTRSSRARFMSSHDSVEVEKMSETEAKLLFFRNANLPHGRRESDPEASKIVKELGCLALAVALAGSYVSETKIEIQQYLPRYRADRTRLLAMKPHKLEHQYAEGVMSTWELSFAALQRQSPVAARLLTLLAFINPNDIFLGLFEDELNAMNDPSDLRKPRWLELLSPDNTKINIFVIESAFAAIQQYSFVSWQMDRTCVMHNLVHAWGHDRLEVPQRRDWSFATLELLNRVTDRNIYNPSIATRMVPHLVTTFTTLMNACGSSYRMPDRVRGLLSTMSANFSQMGQYAHSYEARVYGLQMTELVYGRKHRETLAAMHDLTISLTRRGDDVQAEKLCRESLELQEDILGPRHRDRLNTMAGLGTSLLGQGKYELAEEVLQTTSQLQQEELGSNDPDTVSTMYLLAGVLVSQRKYRQAVEMQRSVLESRTQLSGLEHPETMYTMYRLADTLSRLEEFEEAEQLCRQTAGLQQKVFGLRHPDTLRSRRLLGALLGQKGEYEQAKTIFRETIVLQQQVLGPEHWNVLMTLDDLANVLMWQGEYEEAEQIWRGVVESSTRSRGLEHPDTQIHLHNLALVLNKSKKVKMNPADVAARRDPTDTQQPSPIRSTTKPKSQRSTSEQPKAELLEINAPQRRLSNTQAHGNEFYRLV